MYVIIVMIVVFFTVAISCWWLDDFDEPLDQDAIEEERPYLGSKWLRRFAG